MNDIPAELRYTKSHEWVRCEEDGTVTVGITEHAQDALGDLVFIEPPEPGRKVAAGEACAVVESVKAASDIYAPVSGEIVGSNDKLADAPETVNSDPYDEGWLFRIKPDSQRDITALMDAAAYTTLLDDEGH